MLFKFKNKRCGDHYQDGKCYKGPSTDGGKGDIVESSSDLSVMYPAKFERAYEAEQRAGGIVSHNIPNIPVNVTPLTDEGEDKTEEQVSEPSLSSLYGEDVTAEFPTAKHIQAKVFEKSNWFTVLDDEDNSVLNEKKLRRKDVEPFLVQYLEDDEED